MYLKLDDMQSSKTKDLLSDIVWPNDSLWSLNEKDCGIPYQMDLKFNNNIIAPELIICDSLLVVV